MLTLLIWSHWLGRVQGFLVSKLQVQIRNWASNQQWAVSSLHPLPSVLQRPKRATGEACCTVSYSARRALESPVQLSNHGGNNAWVFVCMFGHVAYVSVGTNLSFLCVQPSFLRLHLPVWKPLCTRLTLLTKQLVIYYSTHFLPEMYVLAFTCFHAKGNKELLTNV